MVYEHKKPLLKLCSAIILHLPALFFSVLLGFCVIQMPGISYADTLKGLPEEMKGAEYVGMETCVACHEEEHKEFQLSAHSRISIDNDKTGAVQGCETCHGPGSLHVDAEGGLNKPGKTLIINPSENPQTCFACHSDKELQFRLPYRHPVLEGKMSCSDCHDLHGSDKRPWTSTSLDETNGACFDCHKDKRGPFVYEHEAVREGCTNCHDVHGSIHDKMLVVRDANLCLRCHSQADMALTIGDNNHTTNVGTNSARLNEGTCFSGGCHIAVHGSNFEPHLRY